MHAQDTKDSLHRLKLKRGGEADCTVSLLCKPLGAGADCKLIIALILAVFELLEDPQVDIAYDFDKVSVQWHLHPIHERHSTSESRPQSITIDKGRGGAHVYLKSIRSDNVGRIKWRNCECWNFATSSSKALDIPSELKGDPFRTGISLLVRKGNLVGDRCRLRRTFTESLLQGLF